MFTVHVVTAAVDTRCGRATTSRERTEVLDYIMCDWLGEKSEKGVKKRIEIGDHRNRRSSRVVDDLSTSST